MKYPVFWQGSDNVYYVNLDSWELSNVPNLPQSPHPPDSRATRPPRHSGRPIALTRRHRRRELVNGLQLRNIGPTKLRRETGLVAGFSVEASLARFASMPPEIVYERELLICRL